MKRILGPQGTIRSYGSKAFLALMMAALAHAAQSAPQAPTAPTASSGAQSASIAGLPLNFERNSGQAPGEVQFLAHGPAYAIAITGQGAALSLGWGART